MSEFAVGESGTTDVSITKVANATPIKRGDTASFTITATNAALGVTATNVTISDTLPAPALPGRSVQRYGLFRSPVATV